MADHEAADEEEDYDAKVAGRDAQQRDHLVEALVQPERLNVQVHPQDRQRRQASQEVDERHVVGLAARRHR
jgi:hypothetical protein